MKKINVIIDADPGADDAVALLTAAHTKQLNILLITTSAGNVELESTTRNALHIVELIGKKIPVAKGAEKPLKRKHKDARYIHRKYGMGGYIPKTPKSKVINQDAVDAMYEQIKAHKNDITIIELGPHTNLANLLTKYPDVKDMIKEIVYMGACDYNNKTYAKHISFNVRTDPEAFKIVYNTKIPLTMVPSNIGRLSYLNFDQVHSLKSSKKYGSFLFEMMIGYAEPGCDDHRAAMNDTCAIAYLANPQIFQFNRVNIKLNTSTKPGKTVFKPSKNGRVNNVVDLDITKLHKFFFNMLKTADEELK